MEQCGLHQRIALQALLTIGQILIMLKMWMLMFMIAKLSSPIKNMRNENADVASVSEDDDRWMTMVTLLLML